MQFKTLALIVIVLMSVVDTSNAAESVVDRLSSGSMGPEMIVIPSGKFVIGSPEEEIGRDRSESPQQEVRIASFAIGKLEVTIEQFKKFIESTHHITAAEKAGGCWIWGDDQSAFGVKRKKWIWKREMNWRDTGFEQTKNHPVLCVNSVDITAYAAWLSEQTGELYRLPTEAEWEYAARAGSTTPYHWGSEISRKHSNYGNDKCCSGYADDADQWINTAPVGMFPGNAFGLSDIHGNATEWTADCWHRNYEDAPSDGEDWAAKRGGSCTHRVARGGSWFDTPADIRVAHRFRILDEPSYLVGFRLVRDL